MGVDYLLKAVAVTIPGHTRAAFCDNARSGFKCEMDNTLSAEAATIPSHTRAACCYELGSDVECDVDFVLELGLPSLKPTPVRLLR